MLIDIHGTDLVFLKMAWYKIFIIFFLHLDERLDGLYFFVLFIANGRACVMLMAQPCSSQCVKYVDVVLVFIVNFEHMPHIVLVFPLLNVNK